MKEGGNMSQPNPHREELLQEMYRSVEEMNRQLKEGNIAGFLKERARQRKLRREFERLPVPEE